MNLNEGRGKKSSAAGNGRRVRERIRPPDFSINCQSRDRGRRGRSAVDETTAEGYNGGVKPFPKDKDCVCDPRVRSFDRDRSFGHFGSQGILELEKGVSGCVKEVHARPPLRPRRMTVEDSFVPETKRQRSEDVKRNNARSQSRFAVGFADYLGVFRWARRHTGCIGNDHDGGAEIQPATPKPKLRWFHSTLQTLLIFVAYHHAIHLAWYDNRTCETRTRRGRRRLSD